MSPCAMSPHKCANVLARKKEKKDFVRYRKKNCLSHFLVMEFVMLNLHNATESPEA